MNPGIPKRFAQATLDDYVADDDGERKVKKVIQLYVERLGDHLVDGRGLLLAGDPGAGKTLLACIIGNAAIGQGVSVFFTTFEEYLRRHQKMITLSNMFRTDESAVEEWRQLDRIQVLIRNKISLLLLDDVGKEHSAQHSNFARDEFDFLLRNRFDLGLTTIITTNEKSETWSARYSRAMQSFIKEACIAVKMPADHDHRTRAR